MKKGGYGYGRSIGRGVCVCVSILSYLWDIWVERSIGSGLAERSHFLCFRILKVTETEV